MPRCARKESSTGYYHVIMRGNNKNYIYQLENGKNFFVKCIHSVQDEGLISIAAWCLMDNHVHLVIQSELKDLSQAFHKVNMLYARHYNANERTVGHVFQNRFSSEPVEDDEYLMCAVRYVHNNPVKAKMVKDVTEYKWSSIHEYKSMTLTEQMKLVYGLFSYDWSAFYKFHLKEDEHEYLDTKEHTKMFREQRAQKIMSEVCKKYGIVDFKDFHDHPEIIDELIRELRGRSGMPLRDISNFLGLNYSRVQAVSIHKGQATHIYQKQESVVDSP